MWEYRAFEVSKSTIDDVYDFHKNITVDGVTYRYTGLSKILNKYGECGWELVSCFPSSWNTIADYENTTSDYQIVLKRPKKNSKAG